MLLNFSVTNFRSFKEQADFSMFPAKSDEKNENIRMNTVIASDKKKLSLLPTAAIYGANASGKTNFIVALGLMRAIICLHESESTFGIKPYLLNKKKSKEPTKFVATIIAEDNVIYEFGFLAASKMVYKEWLYAYPKGRIKVYYERALKDAKSMEYEYINRLAGDKKAWERLTRHDKLFLSTAVNYNSKQLSPVYNWFKKQLGIIGPGGMDKRASAEYLMKGNKKKILNFLNVADFRMVDIAANKEEIPAEIREMIENFDSNAEIRHEGIFRVSSIYKSEDGDVVKLDMDADESGGTSKMFGLSLPILSTLDKGGVLFIDELNNNLHPLLVKHIISLFNDRKINKSNAQLIFSTHDTTLLNNKKLGKGQIWMCDKDEAGASEIYSLDEYKLRDDVTNLQARYLSGRYDAIPNIED